MAGIVETAQELDDRISDSTLAYQVKAVLEQLMPFVLMLLLATLYLEFFTYLTPLQHQLVYTAQRFVLVFFLLELAVDLGIYRDNRQYLKDRWVDIVLVLPFIGLVTGAARTLKLIKGLKPTKTAKGLKSIKGAKAVKGTKAARGAQHSTKLVKKLRDLLQE